MALISGTAIAIGAAIVAAVATTNTGIKHGINNWGHGKDFEKSINKFQSTLEQKGLADIDTRSLINNLWQSGKLDEASYKKALAQLEGLESKAKGKVNWSTFILTPGAMKQGVELYKTLATHAPDFSWAEGKTFDEIIKVANESFNTDLPSVADAPTPEYLDTMFKGTQIDVTETKDWNAKDLAELHDINFDPNHYYDLIKQGTEANLALGEFTNRQLDTLANSQDTRSVVSYLDSIRNAKASAIANGATLGAQAAAEVLANTTAINNYSNAQAQVANTKAKNMSELIQADATANITARQYYDQLAQALSTDAVNAYTTDVERYAQELLTNAELYTADQELRSQRIVSNAEMYRDYISNQAAIDMYRSQLNQQTNEYSWLFQKALQASGKDVYSGSDVYNAYNAVNDYIFNNTNRNVGNDRTTYINKLIS